VAGALQRGSVKRATEAGAAGGERLEPGAPYVEFALARLRDRGFRITRGRRLVVDALERAQRPLSPYALHDLLEEGGERLDTVSIYRTLETLESNGLAHRVAFLGGYLPCRLEDHPGCHHHLICRDCGRVEEVDCPGMSGVEQDAARGSRFRIERHLVEFVGLCPGCQ
jgi:Fe2+ or Zn2+ uptake regulation protein